MGLKRLYWESLETCKKFTYFVDKQLKPFYCPLQQRNNHGLYAVNINAQMGFFAQLNLCLYIFAHCERFNLTPYIILSSPFYTVSRGENWLKYYFDDLYLKEADRKLVDDGRVKVSSISDIEQMGLPSDYVLNMNLGDANRLFEKNLRIKTEIQEYVDFFVEKHFRKKTVLGVHYRGTDKKYEAEPVTWEFCAKTISNYLSSNSQIDTLFIASDEGAFIKWIQKEFRHIEVISHDDKEQSQDGNAIHTDPNIGDNYIKGKEALVNCLLLSKCNVLIKSSSFLSGWSAIFNPSLPVIMLNRPYNEKLWFPDAAIIQSSLKGYLPRRLSD
ncbi:MAG: nodulation protein NodZ [Methylobacter sp.]|nr:nodulation protein NodZ [Methylobacter sp.]